MSLRSVNARTIEYNRTIEDCRRRKHCWFDGNVSWKIERVGNAQVDNQEERRSGVGVEVTRCRLPY